MEKTATKFKWEQTVNTKVLNSIELPDLTFRDHLRFINSKHVKID
ncbi:MAG: hypothetical protein ACTSSC_07335 [Promethearchaeota archaeon]